MNKITCVFLVTLVTVHFACKGKYASEASEAVGIDKVKLIQANIKAKKIAVDTGASPIYWRGTKINSNGFQSGSIKIHEGYFYISNDSLTGGSFIADMNKIKVTSIPPDQADAIENLINHLKSEFDVQRFPTSKFDITKVVYVTPDSLQLSGNLNMKDITKNITFPVKIIKSSGATTFNTTFKFNRFHWNIGTNGSWLEKRVVDKEIELRIKLFIRI